MPTYISLVTSPSKGEEAKNAPERLQAFIPPCAKLAVDW